MTRASGRSTAGLSRTQGAQDRALQHLTLDLAGGRARDLRHSRAVELADAVLLQSAVETLGQFAIVVRRIHNADQWFLDPGRVSCGAHTDVSERQGLSNRLLQRLRVNLASAEVEEFVAPAEEPQLAGPHQDTAVARVEPAALEYALGRPRVSQVFADHIGALDPDPTGLPHRQRQVLVVDDLDAHVGPDDA